MRLQKKMLFLFIQLPLKLGERRSNCTWTEILSSTAKFWSMPGPRLSLCGLGPPISFRNALLKKIEDTKNLFFPRKGEFFFPGIPIFKVQEHSLVGYGWLPIASKTRDSRIFEPDRPSGIDFVSPPKKTPSSRRLPARPVTPLSDLRIVVFCTQHSHTLTSKRIRLCP